MSKLNRFERDIPNPEMQPEGRSLELYANDYVQVEIKPTTVTNYISGIYALNIPNEETTGDWHANVFWHSKYGSNSDLITMGGKDDFDTNDIFGDMGVIEARDKLSAVGLSIDEDMNEVYVANHTRAILDLVFSELTRYGKIRFANGASTDWLDTDEQKQTLLQQARKLGEVFVGEKFEELCKWIKNEEKEKSHYNELTKSKNNDRIIYTMSSDRKQLTYYTPTEEELFAARCEDFVNTQPGPEEEFGINLANARLFDSAANTEDPTVPELLDEGEIWELHKRRKNLATTALEQCIDCPNLEICPGASVLMLEAGVESSSDQELRKLQLSMAREITTSIKGAVVKGGLAMILHGSDRKTGDIDLDISNPTSSTDQKLKTAVKKLGGDVVPKKDTDTTRRYRVSQHSNEMGQKKTLKVELRTIPDLSEDDITEIDGIRVYRPGPLLNQKIGTFLERDKSRDIVDISFLINNLPDAIEEVPTRTLIMLLEAIDFKSDIFDSEENKITLSKWLQDEYVTLKLLEELNKTVKKEIDSRPVDLSQDYNK